VRIFVTGATGVVGRRAVPLLIAAGHQVTAAGRNPARGDALRRAGATVVAADLFDRAGLERAVRGHDVVVNLATHLPSSMMRMMLPGAFRENDRVRREGSTNLADAVLAARVGRFVQESYAPIYEDGGDRLIDESAPTRPVRYNRSVLDAERSARRVGEAGVDAVTLRFATMYGPDSRFFHDAVKMLRNGMAPLPGPTDAYVSSISHDDAASAVVAAITIPAGVYTVSDDEPLPRGAYFAAMADAFALPHPKPIPRWTVRLMGASGELWSRSQRMTNARLTAQGWSVRYPSVVSGFRATAQVMER
jgi:2-alkyl-3-oxoalkanoate reductase